MFDSRLLVDQAYYTMRDIRDDSPGRKHFSRPRTRKDAIKHEKERGWEGEARGGKRRGASDVRIGSRESPWLLECGPLEPGHIQVVQRDYSACVPRTRRHLHVACALVRGLDRQSRLKIEIKVSRSVIAASLCQSETKFLFYFQYNRVFMLAGVGRRPGN